ncbi:hypothetical protein Q2T46_12250 [Thermoanaerobacterium sp. CMT5567-10]|uniref:hypothetical protein n=1 Tax=Thermoanaerobacterium sp. CMT5567-10 TaxID=3061989 RepID=UPI0026DF0F92|nr:hypothetical protein [Thermoanaerobacterium sp. CMT5567-10]WKV08294.1 hypothetical protein Q2T46_12250 [Thermoanaerobacterium sp. CMT5567-10]
MSWTEKGANNLAEILALKTSGKLNSVVETYVNVIIFRRKISRDKRRNKTISSGCKQKAEKSKNISHTKRRYAV